MPVLARPVQGAEEAAGEGTAANGTEATGTALVEDRGPAVESDDGGEDAPAAAVRSYSHGGVLFPFF